MGERSSSRCCCCSWFIGIIVLIAVVLAIVFTIRHNKANKHSDDGGADIVPVPGSVDKNYADALKIAMQFFDFQKSGNDGSEAGLDLSKGLYDAGDHMKFGFPMAFTATLLSWSILEYGHHMDFVNQLNPAKDSLRWITDFLISAHPSANVLYIQILLSRLTFFKKGLSGSEGLQGYKETAEAVMCGLIPNSPTATSSRTDGGLIWVAEWNALQQPVSSAF